jgi:hypothetical protein
MADMLGCWLCGDADSGLVELVNHEHASRAVLCDLCVRNLTTLRAPRNDELQRSVLLEAAGDPRFVWRDGESLYLLRPWLQPEP